MLLIVFKSREEWSQIMEKKKQTKNSLKEKITHKLSFCVSFALTDLFLIKTPSNKRVSHTKVEAGRTHTNFVDVVKKEKIYRGPWRHGGSHRSRPRKPADPKIIQQRR